MCRALLLLYSIIPVDKLASSRNLAGHIHLLGFGGNVVRVLGLVQVDDEDDSSISGSRPVDVVCVDRLVHLEREVNTSGEDQLAVRGWFHAHGVLFESDVAVIPAAVCFNRLLVETRRQATAMHVIRGGLSRSFTILIWRLCFLQPLPIRRSFV